MLDLGQSSDYIGSYRQLTTPLALKLKEAR
jgi:hypothetical protein